MRAGIFIFFTLLFQLPIFCQQSPDYIIETKTLFSEVLQEDRELSVYRPASVTAPLVTIYLLDGEWNFEYVRGLLDLFLRWHRIPDVRLVGVRNVNRTRDFTPTLDDVRFPGSGHADKFSSFMSDELIPFVESKIGKSANRLIIGHSFGGLYALYSLFESPELFDGYIAVSPSVWWKERFMLSKDYAARLNNLTTDPFIYISTGEYDRGNVKTAEEYVEWLNKHAPARGLDVQLEHFKGENHFTNVSISIHRALSLYFPGPERKSQIRDSYDQGGLSQLKTWLEKEKEQLKGRFILPTEPMLELALEKGNAAQYTEAIALLEWFRTYDPKNGNMLYYLGAFYQRSGEKGKALEYLNKALETGLPGRTKIVVQRMIDQLK